MDEWTKGRTRLAALLFEPGMQPDASQIADISALSGRFSISNWSDEQPGTVELLHGGLTFDLGHLQPAAPLHLDDLVHRVDMPHDLDVDALCAIDVFPAPHLAGGATMLPVLRGLADLLISLTALPGLRAVAWCPARNVMSPAWFREACGAWLAGGPFPALALTALYAGDDGGLASEGMAFLTGQEFALRSRPGASWDDDARVAVRFTDWLVAHGRVDAPCDALLPSGGGAVRIEPDGDRLVVRSR
ncbi:hypothetical protein F1640_02970 [Novosphingobium sp. NBM11]|uniref:hypothetical protein n=1 Tax=Novosphingobium sp. NBM11 TaxID=2596914 RepID=UPI00189249B4|nr:hypothetical protein [Novosphingobium sp. NBM11]MBF5089016.1 hypothetical protein [Novosphingobium sp. NBM11]